MLWKAGCRSAMIDLLAHFADKRRNGDLWRHLRCQKPRRKRYASGQERRGMIKNRIGIDIDERPEIVDQKSRIGDWRAIP